MCRLEYHSDEDYKTSYRILLFLCWLIAFTSFNLPGRMAQADMASLDWVALLKIGTRIIIFTILIVLLFDIRHANRLTTVFSPLIPFGLFGLWTVFSATWSPLKAVSLGHGGNCL